MSPVLAIRAALGEFTECIDLGPYIAVPTQCLYPSNKAVSVYVSGGTHSCVVSDNGGAIDEISIAGLSAFDADGMLKQFCRPRGLKAMKGQILSPAVPLEGLSAAVVAVANASSAAAVWGIKNLKPHRRRNLKAEISRILGRHFPPERIYAQESITGASNRRYHIDYVVRLEGDRRLLIDGALPEASSINAKAIAHLDIRRTENVNLISLITYDEHDDWKASDLSLLQMAASLVPLTSVEQGILRLQA